MRILSAALRGGPSHDVLGGWEQGRPAGRAWLREQLRFARARPDLRLPDRPGGARLRPARGLSASPRVAVRPAALPAKSLDELGAAATSLRAELVIALQWQLAHGQRRRKLVRRIALGWAAGRLAPRLVDRLRARRGVPLSGAARPVALAIELGTIRAGLAPGSSQSAGRSGAAFRSRPSPPSCSQLSRAMWPVRRRRRPAQRCSPCSAWAERGASSRPPGCSARVRRPPVASLPVRRPGIGYAGCSRASAPP